MSVEEDDAVGPPIPQMDTQDDEGNVGPMPGDEEGPPAAKKRKAVNAQELNCLDNLPAADRYEKSYMHRNVLHKFAQWEKFRRSLIT